MKQFFCILLAVVLLCASACAESLSLAGSEYSVTLPDGWSMQELEDDYGPYTCLADPASSLTLYVYSSDRDGQLLTERVQEDDGYYNASRSGVGEINGIPVGYLLSEETEDGVTWIVVTYLLTSGSEFLYIDCYMTEEGSSQTAADILYTLRQESAE